MKYLHLLVIMLSLVEADIYLHNPRGSNNRLDEAGRERNNANRLFDSQNNNRGGYNVGGLYYYEGSQLPIEWTNQHSCASPNNHCELIIQYMCSDTLRDGSTTTTIPDNVMMCDNYNCDAATQYGMHEDYNYYLNCRKRSRNRGLFLASQNLNGNKKFAKNTRQNPNGNRRGYECPEERDYYPYWHPTPWKDIAVMTNDASRCSYYTQESENVKSRWACVIPRNILIQNINNNKLVVPNNEADCEAFRWPEDDPEGTRGVWTEFPAHGIEAPVCHETQFSRDNHLGNGIHGYPNVFNWTIPNDLNERCALRIRYNISTEDYDGWNTTSEQSGTPEANIEFAERYGFADEEEAQGRGYVFKNNPQVQIFPGIAMQLAINTAQFGRTFQDRSHVFAIRKRPSSLEGVTIHNVNVRGKRGNIVQVYPAVEYDFVPNTLKMTAGDYIHYQWTGSNTNPNNNDGQGRQGTDRSNVVLQHLQAYPEGTGVAYNMSTKYGHWGRSYPQNVQSANFLGLSLVDLQSLALLTPGQFGGEMSELDDAGTYFDLGPRKITQTGTYHYMCTRNNNFSNRSQKGRIICQDMPVVSQAIGWSGGDVSVGRTSLSAQQGAFSQLWTISIEQWETDIMEEKARNQGQPIDLGEGYASPFIMVHPEEKLAAEGKTFQLTIDIDSAGTDDITIYRSHSQSLLWSRMDADISGQKATIAAQDGGIYIAVRHKNVGLIVGAVIGTLLIIAALVLGTLLYKKRNPQAFSTITRSLQPKV